MNPSLSAKQNSGKRVFLYFLFFFIAIAGVNVVFVYTAIHTHTGVVTENAYEKGLSYNKIIASEEKQPSVNDKIFYENGVFSWDVLEPNGKPVTNATATVKFIRPVSSGHDFSTTLINQKDGRYQSNVTFPLKGLWRANLEAKWDNQYYRNSLQIIVK